MGGATGGATAGATGGGDRQGTQPESSTGVRALPCPTPRPARRPTRWQRGGSAKRGWGRRAGATGGGDWRGDWRGDGGGGGRAMGTAHGRRAVRAHLPLPHSQTGAHRRDGRAATARRRRTSYTLGVPAPQVGRTRGGPTTGGTRACMSEGRRRGRYWVRYGTSVWLTAERSFSCCRGRICTKKSSTGINNTRPTQSARPNCQGRALGALRRWAKSRLPHRLDIAFGTEGWKCGKNLVTVLLTSAINSRRHWRASCCCLAGGGLHRGSFDMPSRRSTQTTECVWRSSRRMRPKSLPIHPSIHSFIHSFIRSFIHY